MPEEPDKPLEAQDIQTPETPPPDPQDDDQLKSPEDIAYERMNASMDSLAGKRDEMIQQLGDAVKNMKLDFGNDAPRMIEVKLAAINAYDGLLKSQESLHVQKVKVGLQKKTEATSDEVKKMAMEVLRNIDMRNTGQNAPVQMGDLRALDTAMSTMLQQDPGSAIKDDELTMDEKV